MAELRATVPKTTFGWARTLGLVGLVLFLFVLGSVSSPAMGRLSVSRATAPSAAPVLLGHAPPPALHVRPLAGSPTIFSFSVAPKTIFEGYPTTFTTNAAGGTGNLTYAYTGLPPGCTSANVSVLFCGPTDNGTFKVTVNVTDINHNATLANTTLFVEPYTSGQFWVHNSTFSDLPQSQQVCSTVNSAPFYSVSCYSSSQFPSLLSLSNGHLGVGYEMYTHSTANTCTGAAVGTTARIGWTSSSDGGIQFGAPANIGNLSCQYLNAIEPSFVNSGSSVYGAFVEENGSSAILPSNYGARASDALGFVSSANNGATWSPVRTLVGTGDIARPEMAAIGNTLYLVYEDVANSSTAIAGGWLPISVEFTVSTNAGGTWSPPVTLPGLNKTASYDAFAPSIAVSPLGPVTVAYATNRSCVNPGAAGACATYGDNIYTTTSANNGSAWGTLELVASAIGESTCYSSGCLPSYFQSTPETSIAIDGAGSLYVAYAGTFNSHSFNPANNYRWTGSYYAVSANGGTSWTTQTIGQAAPGWQTNYFNPSVGVHGTNVVLAYSEDNETLGTAAYDGSLSEWTTNASTGVAGKLTPSILTGIVAMPFGRLTNFTRYSYVGMTSSVTFNATGWPLLAYSLAQTPSVKVKSGPGYYYTNTTYGTNLTVAYRALRTNYAQVVNVTFTEVGLPINESWQFTIDGQTFVLQNTSLTLLNVPRGVEVPFICLLAPHGWQLGTLTQSLSSPQTFSGNTTITFTFTLRFGQDWYPAAGVLPAPGQKVANFYLLEFEYYVYDYPWYYIDIFVEIYGGPGYSYYYVYDDYYNYTTGQSSYGYCSGTGTVIPSTCTAIPLYFNAGMRFQLQMFTSDIGVPSYTNGTGSGAISGGFYCIYTFECSNTDWYGYSHENLTILSPGNQTIWFGASAASEYNETVIPQGLPSGTPYYFTWGAKIYNGTAPNSTEVFNQTLGAYPVSNIWAPGATAGWEYFGHLDGYANHVLVPWTPNVNLSFSAYEDLLVSPQVLTVHATNLTAGVPWSVTFNGTSYGSLVPSLNITAHPGTYPFGSGPAVAPSGTAGFVPVGVPATVTLPASGSTVNLSFVPSYQVSASAALGGTLSVGSGTPTTSYTTWAVPGTQLTFTASPSPGYIFLGWTGTGTGAYTGTGLVAHVTVGSAITEAAGFEALPGARFNLSFQEFGLPATTQWTVMLNGVGYSASTPGLTVGGLYSYSAGLQGQYHLYVPPAYLNSSAQIRYIVQNSPPVVSTNGSSTPPVVLNFAPEASVTVTSTVGGTGTATSGGSVGTQVWALNGTTVTLSEQSTNGYTFTSWTGTGPGAYTGTSSSPSFSSQGAPITELATFTKNPTQPTPHYSVTLNLTSTVAAGTSWSVVLNGVGYSSSSSNLVVTGLLGSSNYALVVNTAYSPNGLTEYTPLATNPSSIHVASTNVTVPVGYATSYWVSISASTGGSASPNSGWWPAGKTVSINALPSGTQQFSKWVGTGPGSYTGGNSSSTIQVNGPITEVAEFQTPTHQTSTTVSSIWQNVGVIAGLAIAGLIVGVVLGLLLFRQGRSPPEESESAAAPEGASGETMSDDGTATPEEGQ